MYPEFYMSFFSLHRWWQSLGFGIQSKTDFAFLHDVLKERLPYYINLRCDHYILNRGTKSSIFRPFVSFAKLTRCAKIKIAHFGKAEVV